MENQLANRDNGSPAVSEMVRQGLTVTRIENESQQSLAIQKPRSEEKVLEGSIKELHMVPELASRAYYSIPYKSKRPDGSEETVYVEGPSIKAAMALARRWGNNSNGARVTEETGDRLTVQGVFVDYETNVRTLRELSVSKIGWDKFKKITYRIREDKLTQAIAAAMSKAVRNATLTTLPAYLVERYVQEAKTIANQCATNKKNVTDKVAQDGIKKLILEMVKMGADKEKAIEAVKEMLKTNKPQEVLATVQGIINAARDGQVNLAETFGTVEAKPNQTVAGEVPNVNDLIGGQSEK